MTTPPQFAMFARHLALVMLFNTLVSGVLMASGARGWDVQLVYSQAIGLSIWLIIDVGRLLLTRGSAVPWPAGFRGIALVVIGIAVGYSVGISIGDAYSGYDTWARHVGGADSKLATSLVATLVAGSIGTAYFYARGKAQYLRAQEAATAQALAEAQLKLLESQLEPHMLFNTLANLRVLITLDPARAQAMLDRLIAFLRATLSGSRTGSHSLREEFARVDDYLELMQIRMGDRLRTRIDLPSNLESLKVPPLLLQPLVENAIKHGLEPEVAGGEITVRAAIERDMLILCVDDTGSGLASGVGTDIGIGMATGMGTGLGLADPITAGGRTTNDAADPDRSRFGLAHVRARLVTLYGDRARLSLEPLSRAPGAAGTRAVISVPLEACR